MSDKKYVRGQITEQRCSVTHLDGSHHFSHHPSPKSNLTTPGSCLRHYPHRQSQRCRNNCAKARTKLFLLRRHCLSSLFINFHFIVYIFATLLFSQFLIIDAYVYTHVGDTQSHLYKRLVGRERREAQREILTMLGLSHRPRLHSTKTIETSSAPLYMLGLDNTASHFRDQNLGGENLDSNHSPTGGSNNQVMQDNRNQAPQSQSLGRRFSANREANFEGVPNVNRYIENSGILSNEIGIFVPNSELIQNELPESRLMSGEMEKNLLDQSDLVISFINTKQQQGKNWESPLFDKYFGGC